eukprot:TRINITY_DN22384_c0_g1_i5.p2 TRINITY_DN22384_c0_g1~~TRINITY_DN22384_c0_g1_i5.p2  ORF type:complete len:106 (-),score=18.23 TRINITY_DN22384_c0_g1_i5:160-477(-)
MKNISDSIIVMRREREIKEKDILGNRENEICIQVRYAHKLVAVEVLKNSAWFVDREGQKVLLGRVRAKLRLLNSLGWRIVIINKDEMGTSDLRSYVWGKIDWALA